MAANLGSQHSSDPPGGHPRATYAPESDGDDPVGGGVRDVEDINVEVADGIGGAAQRFRRQKGGLDDGNDGRVERVARGKVEDEEERTGNFEANDIDYARFLHAEGELVAAEGKMIPVRGTGGGRGFVEGAHSGDDASSASFGKQFKQFGREDGKVLDAASEPSNFRFENDLQSNEISLQDMHRRLNLKNELLDEEDGPMLSGINALNYSDSRQSSAQKGRATTDSRGHGQNSEQLQQIEDQ